jgi:signal transduction histidine kinase
MNTTSYMFFFGKFDSYLFIYYYIAFSLLRERSSLTLNSEMIELEIPLQFLLNRLHSIIINSHFLMEYYLSIHKEHLDFDIEKNNPRDDIIENVYEKLPLRKIIHLAIRDVQTLASSWYGTSNLPEIQVQETSTRKDMMAPKYLYHMLLEIFRNSIKSMVDKREECYEYSPICLTYNTLHDSSSEKDIDISIFDEGKGMSKCEIEKVWNYFYTTSSLEDRQLTLQYALKRGLYLPNEFSWKKKIPISGLGYGIPLTRLVRVEGKSSFMNLIYYTISNSMPNILGVHFLLILRRSKFWEGD